MSGVLTQQCVTVTPVVVVGSSRRATTARATSASRSSSAVRFTTTPTTVNNKSKTGTGMLRGILGGFLAGRSSDAEHDDHGVSCAAAAQGPHAVNVPLPSSGPLAPPPDVKAAVAQWPWRGGLEPCGDRPVAPLPPDAIEGTIPSDLAGTLYRVGPGRIRVGKERYAHWFDGDGQIFAFELDGAANTASAGARMVRTERLVKQEKAGGDAVGIAVRGAWTQANSVFANLANFPTNPANTSPMFHAGKLLVLCEGGCPVEVDPQTLATKGPCIFGDELPMGFSAHAKKDPVDGTLYTWGLTKPPLIGLDVAKIAADGRVQRVVSLPLQTMEMVLQHDCAMSANHLVFIVPPWKLTASAMAGALSGASSFGHAFAWQEGAGAWMVVLRKSDLAVVSAKEIPAMSTYHFAGAYEEEEEEGEGKGKLHVLVNRLIGSRSDLERNFGDMYGSVWLAPRYNVLCDYVVDLQSGDLESSEPLVPPTTGAGGDVDAGQLPMEFPVIAPGARHRAPRFVFTLGFSGAGGGYFDAVQKLDVGGGGGGGGGGAGGGSGAKHATRVMPPGVFPSEVEFIPRKGQQGFAGAGAGAGYEVSEAEEDDGYLVYLEYDAARHRSSLVVLDAKDVTGAPLAVCRLPFHVPHTFHGTFKRKGDAAAGAR